MSVTLALETRFLTSCKGSASAIAKPVSYADVVAKSQQSSDEARKISQIVDDRAEVGNVRGSRIYFDAIGLNKDKDVLASCVKLSRLWSSYR